MLWKCAFQDGLFMKLFIGKKTEEIQLLLSLAYDKYWEIPHDSCQQVSNGNKRNKYDDFWEIIFNIFICMEWQAIGQIRLKDYKLSAMIEEF